MNAVAFLKKYLAPASSLSLPAAHGARRTRIGLIWTVLALCMAVSAPTEASSVLVRAVSYTTDGAAEKVIISLSRPVTYKANVLERNPAANMPWRLYVDLGNTSFAPGVNRHLRPQGGSVRAVRSALNDPRTVRVVLEMNHALRAGDYRIVQHDSPPALEIILPAQQPAAGLPQPVVRTAPAEAPARPEPPKPPVVQQPPRPVPAAKPSGPRTYVIAIDAGHGGRDPGAIGHRGLQEKEISLAIAKALKKALDARTGYTTLMTRTADRFISLNDRAKAANEGTADLLISIHANSHVDPRIDGIETYYLNFSSDAEARRVAARENFTTPEEISDLEMILFDLMQGDKTNISSLLAGYVHNRLTAAITGRYKTLRNLGVKHAPMRVLIDAEMPGILFEAGFISNPEESRRLQDPAHQHLLAEAIADGIHDFFTSSKTALYLNR